MSYRTCDPYKWTAAQSTFKPSQGNRYKYVKSATDSKKIRQNTIESVWPVDAFGSGRNGNVCYTALSRSVADLNQTRSDSAASKFKYRRKSMSSNGIASVNQLSRIPVGTSSLCSDNKEIAKSVILNRRHTGVYSLQKKYTYVNPSSTKPISSVPLRHIAENTKKQLRTFTSKYKLVNASSDGRKQFSHNRELKRSKSTTLEAHPMNYHKMTMKTPSNFHSYQATHYRRRLQKAMICLRFQKKTLCSHYVRTGRCSTGDTCRFLHDVNYLRICPRFLSQSCQFGEATCPLAHVLDPCRLPACEFHTSSSCTRTQCPYLHTDYPVNTPICPDFIRGRCPRGRSCRKRHILNTKLTLNRKAKMVSIETQTEDHDLTEETSTQPCTSVSTEVATVLPDGSLRHIYPAPEFIPLFHDGIADCTDSVN